MPFGEIVEGAKAKAAMRTRSHTEKNRRPCSKSDAVVVFGDPIVGMQRANPMLKGDRSLRNYPVAIFEEHLVNSARRLDVIVDAPSRTRLLSYIAGDLVNQGIFADFRVFSGSSGRVPDVERFLNYCIVPTESKWMVDPSPILYNCEIPIHITDDAEKPRRS